MRIAFYFAETWPWDEDDLEGTGLGGAETALVFLARAMARWGQRVTVFNRTRRSGVFPSGVEYRHVDAFRSDEPWDVLIGLSFLPVIGDVPAAVKIHLSMEDSESWVRSYREVLPHVRAVFTLSPHHTAILTGRFGIAPNRIVTTRLGIDPQEFANPLPKVPGRLIYCSVPDCGLGYVAPVFAMVRRQVPGASLVVTGDFTLWGRADPGTATYLPALRALPGVVFLGKVPRSELTRQQKTAEIHLYPCVCNELFCLSSIECQAAGTPTVALAAGALATTVEDGVTGILIRREPQDERAVAELARAVAGLLRDRPRLARMASQARQRALGRFTYDRVVAEWLGMFRAWGAGG